MSIDQLNSISVHSDLMGIDVSAAEGASWPFKDGDEAGLADAVIVDTDEKWF